MNNKTDLITNIVMYVILAVSLVLAFLSAGEADLEAAGPGSSTGTVISWSIGVLVFGLVCAVFAEVMGVLSDPSGIVKTVVALVGVAALVGICWALSDGTPLNIVGYEGDENVPFWLKLSDTSIFVCYIALGGAIVSIVVTEIIQFFR